MLNYYIAYSFMTLSAIWLNRGNRSLNPKNKQTYCVIFAIIWIVLLGLRHPAMGIDLGVSSGYGYIGQFEYIQSLDIKETFTITVQNYEPGYIIFNKLISYISSDPQWLIFCVATISVISSCLFISKNSELPFLSSIIYLGLPSFLINYSGLRQSLAISITILSYELVKRKKLLWFIITVLFATSFHASAVVFLIAYPLYHVNLNKGMQIASIFILPITFLLRVPLFNVLSKILKKDAEIDNNGAFFLFAVFSAVYIFIILFSNRNDPKSNGLRNLYFFACFCQAFSGIYSTALRVGYYFLIYLAALLPQLINSNYYSSDRFEYKRNSILIYLLIIMCFFAFGIYSISSASWAMSNPHFFYWQ